ncbi:MAG TPA: HAMP domain-containing sensor histidine kinase, partial [Actinomycetota bacterium]|nr:HAMP domain-containing sensor histidine kinase [Actinomycetota bacterium]
GSLAAPLLIGGEVVGVLHASGHVDTADLEVADRLAGQVALVVYSARLHAERAGTVTRLRELAEMKSDFVAITSHELRTPLTGIRGFASLLLTSFDDLPQEDVREFLTIIDAQSQRLSRLVEDLLVVSKLENGRLKLEPREVEIRPFLEGIVASFAEDAGRIELDLTAQGTGRFDPDRVEQIVRNLVHNALKFSPPSATVELRAGEDGAAVALEVEDHGVGIPRDQAASIFDRFHQVGDRRSEGQGVGLGLYITKRLLDEMGGTVAVRSEPGHGTTFSLRIPQAVTVVDQFAATSETA